VLTIYRDRTRIIPWIQTKTGRHFGFGSESRFGNTTSRLAHLNSSSGSGGNSYEGGMRNKWPTSTGTCGHRGLELSAITVFLLITKRSLPECSTVQLFGIRLKLFGCSEASRYVTVRNPSKLRGSGLVDSCKCSLQRLVPEGYDHDVCRCNGLRGWK
jgi:hypothetical protein